MQNVGGGVRKVTVPSRSRLDRLWRIADELFMAKQYGRSRRVLQSLLRHDPNSQRVRNKLDVVQLLTSRPPWKFLSMSSFAIDRRYAWKDWWDERDDPAGWDELPEESDEWDEVSTGFDWPWCNPDVRKGEDAADALEERLTRQGRGKDDWRH